MSIKAMTWAWDNSKAAGSELLLLLALADHAADDGYCWPSIETLAQKIRMSTRSVIRLIKALEERGDLRVVRGNANNRYVLIMGRDDAVITEVLAKRGGDNLSRDKLSRDTDVTTGSDICVTSEVTQLCHPNHQEPSSESSIDEDDEKGVDRILAMVIALYEQEIGGTMTAMIADELRELTETERNIDRWRDVFKRSIGKSNRWAWIRKVIANPLKPSTAAKPQARQALGASKRPPASMGQAAPAGQAQRIQELIQSRNGG